MSTSITIMTTTMKTTIMSMSTNIIMNMMRTAPADATTMIMTTNMTMNTITIMKTMSTIMNMTKTAPADAMTTIIITIMQMKCLQAGAKRLLISSRRKRSRMY